MAPTLSQQIAPHLPYLRRYARALAGSQEAGDALVAAALPNLAPGTSARNALYSAISARATR